MKNLKTYKGGSAELKSYNPYDGGTVQFNGNSHENGGIDMSYMGKPANVEGGETAVKTKDGGLMIMGNMVIPGTKTKFKSASKAIAKKESTYAKLMFTGNQLVDEHNTQTKWDRLKFTTGSILMGGAEKGQKDLANKKLDLTTLQQAMLDASAEAGIDPIAMSEGKVKKAKNGLKLAPGGEPKPSVAKRHNNPGNIKYNPKLPWMKALGAVQGEPAKDGGFFAKFPDVDSGLKAIQENLKGGYGKYTGEEAIKRWTNNTPYNIDLGELKTKKVKDMTPKELAQIQNVITQGEDGKLYNFPLEGNDVQAPAPDIIQQLQGQKPFTSTFGNPNMAQQQSATVGVPSVNDTYNYNTNQKKAPIYQSKFDPLQLAGEAYALAANRQEYVPAQNFDPQLFQQYNVSFQDILNENQAGFNSARRAAAYNPSQLGDLTAQLYGANAKVGAEEFRTNQAISNEITNKNIGLLNDAQLKNLQIADTQMVRQSQAKSNTKQTIQNALNSVSAKYLQHKQMNSELGFYQDMFNYRPGFDDKGQYSGLEYQGPDASFGHTPAQPGSINSEFQSRTVQKTLPDGSKEKVTTPAVIDQKIKTQKWFRDMSPNRMFKIKG